jgi:phosphohistidine phosphatase
MKKLILVRHGKAEDDSPGISDFERSLVSKGKLVTRAMAHRLKSKEKSPGTLVSSPAFRALETALIFAGEFGIRSEEIVLDSNIYNGISLKNLPVMLSSVGDDADTITLFGHNPVFSDLANDLCKEGCDPMVKSEVVCLSFNIKTWSEIHRNSGKLEYVLKPEK